MDFKRLMRAIICGATPIVAAEARVLGVDQSPRQNRSSTVMLSAWIHRHFSPINSDTRNPVHTLTNVGNGCTLYMPIVGWYSPNGNYTEGSGVQPDVLVDIDPEAHARGSDAQLSRALEVLQ